MPDRASQDIRDRTGPLHRALGLTAAATHEEFAAALSRLDDTDPLASIADSLAEPSVREAYEELVLAARRGERIRVPADEAQHTQEFAVRVGVQLLPVRNRHGEFEVSLPDPSGADGRGSAVSVATDNGVETADHSRRVSAPDRRSTTEHGLSVAARLTGALRQNISAQILAGLAVVAALAALAWWVAPRPAPPSPEVLASRQAKVELRDAITALESLREQCRQLDATARQLIGPSHRWHNVDSDPPPLAVAEWIRSRDRGDSAVLLGYNRIAEARLAADGEITTFEADLARLTRDVEHSATEAQIGEARILAQHVRDAADSLAERATELRRLHESP